MTETDANLPSSKSPLIHYGHPESHIPGYEVSEATAPPITKRAMLVASVVSIVIALTGFWFHHYAEGAAPPRVTAPWMLPFVLLLGSIAAMPFIARHWWEHNYARVAIALGLLVAIYYAFALRQFGPDGANLGPRAIAGSLAEYISFIFLLGSLFVISGGILIRVRATATPIANTSLLFIGAIIANLFGTTGASMLLIRPFLRMNKGHIKPFHVVFFIFIVSNAGGSLTPIGDPPLFLGFLQGVPFWWVLEHCWPVWMLVNGALLALFFILDTIHSRKLRRTGPDDSSVGPAVSLWGAANLVWIAFVIGGILLHAPINHTLHNLVGIELPIRELAMALAAIASLAFTPHRVHAENHFNYAPIKDVAFLFIGIFLTMVPALNFLYHENAKPPEERRIAINTPGQFYFASGILSSVLDNAPTYLTFLQSKLGQLDPLTVERVMAIAKRPGSEVTSADLAGLSDDQQKAVHQTIEALLEYHKDRVNQGNLTEGETRVGFLVGDEHLNLNLIAISMGAVLFGAMTYIGNGPNFMVKSIADHAGAPTPSFFGYVFRYAIPFLLPLLIVVWLVFLK